jgi:hypothetical protein
VPAEEYLGRHPEVGADAEAAVDLIFNEFLLREQQGEGPSAEEYLRRFPEHAEALGAQIDFHRAMREGPPAPMGLEPGEVTFSEAGAAPPGAQGPHPAWHPRG